MITIILLFAVAAVFGLTLLIPVLQWRAFFFRTTLGGELIVRYKIGIDGENES
ncbi:MAG TPA: hypothetical protein VGK39_02970 [Cyclobacteriaceae bacterium]